MIILNIILLVIGFIMLIKCADMFVDSSSNIARALGVSTLIIGLTIVAFGTSAPEAAVSLISSIQGKNDISMGNIVGSNICNLLLVLGVGAMFGKLKAKKKILTRDFIYSIFSYIVLIILTFEGFMNNGSVGTITRTSGMILLCFLAVYVYSLIIEATQERKVKEEKTEFKFKDIALIVVGILGIALGGELVVDSATKIASFIGVSDSLIALTVVAIGTSLPELVTSAVAVKKGETDLAIGNVIGSNIFNIFFVLGISSVVSPITFGLETFIDTIIMLAAGIIVYLLALKNYRIGNKKGILMIGMYLVYILYIIFR